MAAKRKSVKRSSARKAKAVTASRRKTGKSKFGKKKVAKRKVAGRKTRPNVRKRPDAALQSVGISFVPKWLKDLVASQVKTISEDVRGVANSATAAVTTATGKLHDASESLVTGAEEIGTKVTELPSEIVTGVGGVAKHEIEQLMHEVKRKIEKTEFVKEIEDRLRLVNDLVKIIKLLEEHAKELGAEKPTKFLERLDWVFNVCLFLMKPLVHEIEGLEHDFKAARKEAETNLALAAAKVIISLLMRMNPAFATADWVIGCVWARKLNLPEIDLPFGPGRFYEFINEGGLEAGERDFRIELVGAIDRFIHSEFDMPNVAVASPSLKDGFSLPGPAIDALPSSELLTGLVRTIVQTTLGFVFRLPHVPSFSVPKMSLMRPPIPELKPSAIRMSVTFSRSISHPLKALSGLGLRGVWEFSSHNEALVESAASSVASTVVGVLEAAIQSVLSLIEVRELADDKHPRCLRGYPKTIPVAKKVFDVLWIRSSVPDSLVSEIKNVFGEKKYPIIDGLLKDYVAYLEVSQVLHEPDLTDETIKVSSAAWTDKGIAVEAIYDPADGCRPVLRAYAEGRYAVLKYDGHAYSGTIEGVKKVPETTVHVIARELAHGSTKLVC